MRKRISIFILIILFIGGCSIQNQKSQQKDKTTTRILYKWRLDTNGCRGYRSIHAAIYIRDSIDFIDKDTSYIYNLLGHPNQSYERGSFMKVTYTCNITCKNNKVNENIDRCYLNFLLDSNKVSLVMISCE